VARHHEGVTKLDQSSGDERARDGLASKRRRRPDRGLLIASFVISLGLVLVVWGFFTAITGDEGVDRPAAIESVSPVENAIQVLQQESISVDLQFGYEAMLIVDGIELETTSIGQVDVEPGSQLEFPPTAIFDPGNSIISFTPNDEAVISELSQGRHEVTVRYWRIEDGPSNATSYRWTFVVI
jgi:hypothetical protein